jgi:hypothetical protein
MMLLTYEQLAEIPDKLHIFYEQAFDTLFHKHDALKSLYKRKTYTGLPIDEFKILFSAFCILSYSDKKHSFDRKELVRYVKTASTIESIDVNSNDYINDLLKSVCVMQKDGLNYLFSHRSFQEYFSALFISRTHSADVAKIIDKVALYATEDSMLNMLFDMNRELVETKWIIPKLAELRKVLSKIDVSINTFKYLAVLLDRIMLIEKDKLRYILRPDDPNSNFFVWLVTLYKDKHPLEPSSPSSKKSISSVRNIKKFMEDDRVAEDNPIRSEIAIRELVGCDGEPWVKESIIYDFCHAFEVFSSKLEDELNEKYSNKKSTLADMLLKKA